MSARGGVSPPRSKSPTQGKGDSHFKPLPLPKANADKPKYQTRITSLEEHLLKHTELLPTLSKTKISSKPTIIPNTSQDNFHFTTVKGHGDSCHAILVYVRKNDKGQNTVYYYDPAGKSSKDPHTFKINGSKGSLQINPDMCPDKGINPEGYCALWSIVVVILWDRASGSTFGEKMSILQEFNSKITGTKTKVPGLRKWFIATIYYLLMKNRDYTREVTNEFIDAVWAHIQLVLNYDDSSEVKVHVVKIAKLIEEFDKHKEDIKKKGLRGDEEKIEIERNTIELDKAVDTYIKSIMSGSGAAAGAAAADDDGAVADDDGAVADSDGPDAGAGAVDSTSADGGGLRRARSLRRKNKMYRSKKLKKKRRTMTRRSKRNYRK